MTTSGKIRLLLTLIGIGLLFTAIFIQKTYTPVNNLDQTARELEDNLHKKEAYIDKQLSDKAQFNKFKILTDNDQEAINGIETFTAKKNTWFITTYKNHLSFWSGIKVLPDSLWNIKEGNSFIKQPNGYYEAIRKTDGDFSVIFFIPVKNNYTFTNQYLQNTFAKDLITSDNIELADLGDKDAYDVHSISNDYLFSVKQKANSVNYAFIYYEAAFWILTILTLCILIHNICCHVAAKGYAWLSVIFLAFFIMLFRFVNLYYHLPDFSGMLKLFDPQIFNSGILYPSFGDLCINLLCFFWFVVFIYLQRRRLFTAVYTNAVGYFVVVGCILLLIAISTSLLRLFSDLVINSGINFNVNNVLGLSSFSVLGVLMLCFSFLIFYLVDDVVLFICLRLGVPRVHQLLLLIAGVAISTAVFARYYGFSLFYLLWMMLVLIRAFGFIYHRSKLTTTSFLGVLLICSLISAIKLNHFESIKEEVVRKKLVHRLEDPVDHDAENTFIKTEKRILIDTAIVRYFKENVHNTEYLLTRFQKLYFDGYLSKYVVKIHEYDANDQPLVEDDVPITSFKDQVVYNSYKVVPTSYFYRGTASFGLQSYFAILPIKSRNKQLGTLAIEFTSKPLQSLGAFPDLLIDGSLQSEDEFKDYSYAYYYDNRLQSQRGTYVYTLNNPDFKGVLKKYIIKTTRTNNPEWYNTFTKYEHLIYKPNKRNIVVASKETNPLYNGVTSITFFFMALLVFSAIIIIVRGAWVRVRILSIKDDKIRWNFRINFDKVLYKTRIQFVMIFAVVVTLIAVGFITFVSIGSQYQSQQDKQIRNKITRIAEAFQTGALNKYIYNVNEKSQVDFDIMAKTYSTDLVLFDINGVPLVTTQPKMYEAGLVAKKMNSRAFIYLSRLQKTEFVNDERIGELSYKAAYAPITSSGRIIAYIQLPYFSNEADYKERITALLNVMINVYTLVFIAIGLFAIIIARQITTPLSFIQETLSKTIYGKKNEPIKWQRNDEIGALVKEYNKMISALENSANRLAQSERESAWREMAKQVAHEIKNPLTPLKLGLQLLDKSWRDKDPKFDQKFERFSKSFVEQIESLSSIASEFSAFAKMPDTRIEQLNVFEMLNQAVTIFKQMDNMHIMYQPPAPPFMINADKDQLLRCFNNLLKNAIEATPPDRKGLIDINYLITSKNVLLTIKDNGNGIPENMREKIFEPNFTTKSSGTGLGLAFVKNSIENANGKIWFETTIGIGTTFYLSFPSV
ncbi:ATP-binding protein [Mucilaginibacter sp. AW1-7]|uniref:ATP-binding protein n=1 Tax=Mucilaginibacter sp. AW1-7 TaxID=3349874 RepID=UPI003F73415A